MMYRQRTSAIAGQVYLLLCVCVLSCCAARTDAAPKKPAAYQGPCAVAVSQDGKTLFVANSDACNVAWVDVASGKVSRRVEMPARPTGIALTPDGAELAVTCAAPESTVLVLDTASGRQIRSIPVGHTAVGPAITPDGRSLYVCNRFDNDVSVIDLETGTERARVDAVREPVATAVTPDGETVLIINHLPNTRTDLDFPGPVSPVVTVIDTQTDRTTEIELPYGSNGLRDAFISPDGRYAYVPHILSNFDRTPSQVELGWTNLNVLSVIDIGQKTVLSTIGLDDMYQGFGNPWAAVCTDDGKTICVCHAGTNELTVLDSSAARETPSRPYLSPLVAGIPEVTESGAPSKRRIALPGHGPRGLAVFQSQVYVAEYFSDTVAVVDLRPGTDEEIRTISLGPPSQMTDRRRGEFLFHSATICYQHWQSCATCHPDGRIDALNWDLLNDGIGTFKNTKSLLLAHRTPPAMAEGVRPTAEAAVRSGIVHILFSERPEEEASAIDTYLAALQPVPSPHLVQGQLSPSAARGERLFASQRIGCHRCHPAPLYTDRRMHDVGTRSVHEYSDRFDTPTLIEVWRTAPYLHDGRYTTIRQLLVEGRHGLSHLPPDALTEQEINDLVAFALSL